MVEKQFYGERLKSARMFRGLTLTELAKRTQISKQSLSLYENDNNKLDHMKVKILASELDFPYDYFFQKDSYVVKTETTYFRSLASATKKLTAKQILELLKRNGVALYSHDIEELLHLRQDTLKVEEKVIPILQLRKKQQKDDN